MLKRWEVMDIEDKKVSNIKNLYQDSGLSNYIPYQSGDRADPDNMFKCHLDDLFGVEAKELQVFYLNDDFRNKLRLIKKA